VQNGKNGEAIPVNPVGNDIWCARHDEFASFRFAAGPAKVGMLGEAFHGREDSLRHAACCRGLILLDVLANFGEVGDGRFGPNYSHDGGGSSRFLPQERSQRAVFS
jgi:hypothetical protein